MSTTTPTTILSPAELDVLTLMLRGLTNREIADKRCNAIQTISTTITHIFVKLGIETEEGSHRINSFALLSAALDRYGLGILAADSALRRSIEATNWVTA